MSDDDRQEHGDSIACGMAGIDVATLAESMSIPVFVTAEGHNIYVNSAYAEFTGLSAAALLGRGFMDVVHPDDAVQMLAMQKYAKQERGVVEFEIRIRRADGAYCQMLCRSAPCLPSNTDRSVVAGSLVPVLGAGTDASGMTEMLTRLRYAQEAGRIGLWEWDVATGKTWWSHVLYGLLGQPVGDGVSSYEAFFASVHPEDRDGLNRKLKAALERGTAFDEEFRIIRQDGSIRWLAGRGETIHDGEGRVARMMGVNFDISDRKAVETKLVDFNATLEARIIAETEQRERLWSLSQDLIVHAANDGSIIRANPAARRLLADRSPFLADADNVPIPPVRRAFDTALTGRYPVEFSTTIAVPDGDMRHISWSVTLDPDSQSFFAIGRDVTPVVRAHAQLRESEERLAQLQRVDSIGQLTSGVAHDFNNLLGPIVSALDMLERRPQGEPDLDALISGASRAALKARSLVRRMLSFAQRSEGRAERVDITALLAGMRELIVHVMPKTIALRMDIATTLPPISVDPGQLELAILNLVVNARDAMPGSGALEVTARHDGANVVIAVTDNGAGMDAATLTRATEAFFTTKSAGKGTGLGLYMANRLAERFGGFLAIVSEPGCGATVSLSFPALPPARD